MKPFYKSKTFWAATIAAIVEALQAIQAMPFLSEGQTHTLAVTLAVFIAINRIYKK